MSWSARIRSLHRWLSILFTGLVIVNTVLAALNAQVVWIGLLTLAPLLFLMLTGLYLFVLPSLSLRG